MIRELCNVNGFVNIECVACDLLQYKLTVAGERSEGSFSSYGMQEERPISIMRLSAAVGWCLRGTSTDVALTGTDGSHVYPCSCKQVAENRHYIVQRMRGHSSRGRYVQCRVTNRAAFCPDALQVPQILSPHM